MDYYLIFFIIIIVLIFLTIFVLSYRTYIDLNDENNFVWLPTDENKLNFGKIDINHRLKLFIIYNDEHTDENYGIKSIRNSTSIEFNFGSYYDYYELCIYSGENLVKSYPYPNKLVINCDKDIPPGDYLFLLRCYGMGSYIWSSKNAIKFHNKIIYRKNEFLHDIVTNDDSNHYENLGSEYNKVKKNYNFKYDRYVCSENKHIKPFSNYIFKEEAKFDLNYDEEAIIIVPNRKKTMNCSDLIFMNGHEMHYDHEAYFNSYYISGNQQKHNKIIQYIFGNLTVEKLPIYVYIHKK